MLKTEPLLNNIVKITVPKKLKSGDFKEIAPLIDAIIAKYAKVKLLIDAREFEGWENTAAFEEHAGFVKSHHQNVERLAIITGYEWQNWLIGTFKIFVHPQIAAFNKGEEQSAQHWLKE